MYDYTSNLFDISPVISSKAKNAEQSGNKYERILKHPNKTKKYITRNYIYSLLILSSGFGLVSGQVRNNYYVLRNDTITKCPNGHELSRDECVVAGLAEGAQLREGWGGRPAEGTWLFTPGGCFIGSSPNDRLDIHYSNRTSGFNTDDSRFQDWSLLCKTKEYYFVHQGTTAKCPDGHELSQEECLVAGLAEGAFAFSRQLKVGHWDYTPLGCFTERDLSLRKIHYSTRSSVDVNNVNLDYWSFLCRNNTLPFSDKTASVYLWDKNTAAECPQGTAVPVDRCLESLRGLKPDNNGRTVWNDANNNGQLQMSTWTDTPCGCFIQEEVSENAYYLNYDYKTTGCVQSVKSYIACTVPPQYPLSEVHLWPTDLVRKCPAGSEISQNKCMEAGRILVPDDMALQNDSEDNGNLVVIENRLDRPCGCFVWENRDLSMYKIIFNTETSGCEAVNTDTQASRLICSAPPPCFLTCDVSS